MEVVASLSKGRTAATQCGLFTYKSVPVIFEPPCTFNALHQVTFCVLNVVNTNGLYIYIYIYIMFFVSQNVIVTGDNSVTIKQEVSVQFTGRTIFL